MNTDLLQYLSQRIQEERKALADDLSLGKAKEHGDYKYTCGVIRGLLIVNNMIIETAERLEREENE
jgi:hypothetical protein